MKLKELTPQHIEMLRWLNSKSNTKIDKSLKQKVSYWEDLEELKLITILLLGKGLNSHCRLSLTDKGAKYLEGLKNG